MEQLRTMTVENVKRKRGRAKKIKIKDKEEEAKEINTDNKDKEPFTNNEIEDENDTLIEIPTNKPFVFSYYGKFILIGTSGKTKIILHFF